MILIDGIAPPAIFSRVAPLSPYSHLSLDQSPHLMDGPWQDHISWKCTGVVEPRPL